MSISISPHGTFWRPHLEADKRRGYAQVVAISLGLSFGLSYGVAMKRLTGTWERLVGGGAGGALLAIPVGGAAALLYRTGARSTEERVRRGVDRWYNDSSVEGDKETARAEVIRAFLNQSNTLNLGNLRLTCLPPEIGCLTNVKNLYVQGNQLKALPQEMARLPHLEQLYLRGNPLRQLSDWVGDFEKLGWLDLSSTQLELFPPAIARLKELIVLRVNSNGIESLPDEIGNLTKLRSLEASDNALSRLPNSMSRLHQLNELKLARNPQLTEVAASIFTLPQLRLYARDLEGTGVQYEVDPRFERVASVTLHNGEKVQSNWPNFGS